MTLTPRSVTSEICSFAGGGATVAEVPVLAAGVPQAARIAPTTRRRTVIFISMPIASHTRGKALRFPD